MRPFFQAIAFLTRLPVPAFPYSEKDWEKSPAYYPLVGMILGLILWGAASALPFLFSERLSAALLLVIWVMLTGGLHLDGWIDVADGLGSHRSPERMREIMKDSRVGAMGALAAILLLLVKWASVYDMLSMSHLLIWLTLSPWIARLLLLLAMRYWPYASENGIGRNLVKRIPLSALGAHAVLLSAFVWMLGGGWGFAILGLSIVVGLSWIGWLSGKFKGLTGDGYGATVECVETVVLLVILLLERWL